MISRTNALLFGILVILLSASILTGIFSRDIPEDKEPGKSDDPNEIIITPVKNDNSEELIISLYNHWEKKLVKISLEEYLTGVLAGEMPASYEMEALKAQAVAARTLVVYQLPAYGGRGCSRHDGADVCSSYAHCQEWISREQMRRNWGEDFESNFKRIEQAVQETKGQIMTYQGKAIEVFYHSTSNGRTEDVREVFSNSLPYYTSVESIGEENGPMFEGSVTLTNKKFAEVFKSRYGIKLNPDNLASQIKIDGYTDSGRIRTITVGGKKLKATEFRLLYGLNSTDITFVFGKDTITMKTRGFGHGVGMSQVGAHQMAGRGSSYKEILQHYYRGVEITHY
ncbi:MAG: stage II sporulation protein D [Caldicoprobacterales bacterium]|nr:stage II sporulation protein D [Clostridiales bacterium]